MKNYLIHYGIKGQKWGVRRFQNPDGTWTEEGKLVRRLHRAAIKNEPKITKAVTTAAKIAGSKMYGLEHRLKTTHSTARKINTDSIEKGISKLQAANDIKDSVRYTTITDDSDFVESYETFKSSLEKIGYTETRCKNYWDLYRQGKVKHKSVQSVFESPDGYIFEVQFQTPSSQRAKDKKVPIYEERRQVGIDPSRARELEEQMEELARSVPTPKNIYRIKSH